MLFCDCLDDSDQHSTDDENLSEEYQPESESEQSSDDEATQETRPPQPGTEEEYITLPILSLPKSHSRCSICPAKNKKLRTIPADARTQILIDNNIIVPVGARCCPSHIHDGKLRYSITITDEMLRRAKPSQLSASTINNIIQSLRAVCNARRGVVDFDGEMSDADCYNLTGIFNHQLDDLVSQCSSLRDSNVRSCREAVGIYLTKMRTGLSNTLLATLFHLKSKRSVSRIIHQVRAALMKDFVPNNVGFSHISRDDVTGKHTTTFARELLADGNKDIVILIMDGTYIYIQKSGKYTFQRISFSMHKGRPLVKPMVITASDGYIMAVLGPYLAKNNDANITTHVFNNNEDGIQTWLKALDILVLDRGFRDCLEFLECLGYKCESPPFLGKDKQHTTQEANLSRLITKIRWVVESVNGRLKKWEFLG